MSQGICQIFIATKYLAMNIFCSATWEDVNINLANRTVKYCCHSEAIDFPVDLTVDWLKNNKHIQERKQYMLNNQRHKHCSFCYKQEDTSGTSIRFLKNNKDIEPVIKNNPEQDYITKIEIAFDNICNQSCLYCNENYSSVIAEEKGIEQKFKSFYNEDIEVIVEWLSSVYTSVENPKTIRLLGGEPTASRNYFNFLSRLIERCSHKHFIIHTITNCNTTDKGLEKLNSYLSAETNWQWSFGISNESTGKLSENVRYGLDWNRFDKCVKFYANHPNVFFVTVVMTPNVFTIKDIANYFTYIDNIFKKSNKNYGYAYNWVYEPEILSPAYLPIDYKKYIQETKELAASTTSNLHKDSFLNYLSELEKLIGSKILNKEKLLHWLEIQNAFKKHRLDIALLMDGL